LINLFAKLPSRLRLTHRVSGFLFFAVLAAGVAIAPLGLAAQHPLPAAGSVAAASAPDKAAPEAPQSQEEQDKVFLLGGPIVKWTAKTFNLKIETASEIYQVVNFVALVLLIGIPIVRVLPKVFRKRSQTLEHNLRTARESTEAANARLGAVEARLAGLDEEIKKFRAQVEQESLEDEARIKSTLAEESTRIVQAAEQELSVAAAHARRSLRHFAADLAVEQAAKQMVLTHETDRTLIAEFIGGVSPNGTKKKEGHN
jgi:F-type H+-transporting ATPase subunit b